MTPFARDRQSPWRAGLKRWKRRFLLHLLARQRPEQWHRVGRKRLERAFARAARTSTAYRTLLDEAGFGSHLDLDADAILDRAPILEKSSTFGRFPLRDLLARDVSTESLAGILTSSGHGGKFAFGVSTWGQMRDLPDAIDLGLQFAFGTDDRRTLLVNCLPMGVVFTSHAVCVANVSVREDMALAILSRAGPVFDQVVICADPLFLKRLLDTAAAEGFDWSARPVHVILGEETFAEDYRTYVAGALGHDPDMHAPGCPMIGSSLGVAELGLNLFFETRATIAVRRAQHRVQPLSVLPTFFCYDPLRVFAEIHAPDRHGIGELLVTMLDPGASLPLVRYRTGDLARWPQEADYRDVPDAIGQSLRQGPLPVIAISGRQGNELEQTWRIDDFKALLYCRTELADHVTGAFRLCREDSALRLDVQMREGSDAIPDGLSTALKALLQERADRLNRVMPAIACHRYESFPYGMGLDYERKFRYVSENPGK